MQFYWANKYRDFMNHTLIFVYDFKGEDCGAFTLNLNASNSFRVILNGKMVMYGPIRAGHGYSRVMRIPLKLEKGGSRLVVEVAGYNVRSFYQVDELPFFAAQIFRGKKLIASTSDFAAYLNDTRIAKVQRYSFQRPFAECYKLSPDKLCFYYGGDIPYKQVKLSPVASPEILDMNVSLPALKPVKAALKECGKISVNDSLPLWKERALNNIENLQIKGYKYCELDEYLSDEVCKFEYTKTGAEEFTQNGYKRFSLAKCYTGFITLDVKIVADSVVYIIFDEILSTKKGENGAKLVSHTRYQCCNVIKYYLKAGNYKLISFEPYEFKHAAVIVFGKAQIRQFGLIKYINPDAKGVVFRSGNKTIDSIFYSAKNTFEQNAVDVLTDCSGRERAGWLCDSYFTAISEKLFTGKNIVERNFLQNYLMQKSYHGIPDGMLPMCYPADHFDGVYIPNWAMWFVVELDSYVKRSGDTEMALIAKEKLYKLHDFFVKYENNDGLLENLDSWVFVEWSKCNDPEFIQGINYPTNMLYSLMCQCMGNLYNDDFFIKKSQKLQETIRKQSFDGQFFVENCKIIDGKRILTENYSETCQYYAFFTGTANKEFCGELYNIMLNNFGVLNNGKQQYNFVAPSNALIGNMLRLIWLIREDKLHQAEREIEMYYANMAKLTGTLWENDGAGTEGLFSSCNHGFESYIAVLLAQINFGIKEISGNKITLSDNFTTKNGKICIPSLNGLFCINIKDGKRQITGKGYNVLKENELTK